MNGSISRRRFLLGSSEIEIAQYVVLKSNTTYTVPEKTIKIDALVVGGGGGGGLPGAPSGFGGYTAGYAGKGGEVVYTENITFTIGEQISAIIGKGGTVPTTWGEAGSNGGQSSFGTIVASGGNGGQGRTNTAPAIGADGTINPFNDIPSENILSNDLFGANGGDGSTTTTFYEGGNTGGGKGANRSTNAENATFFGAGGGGGVVYRSFSATIRKPGIGADGVVILKVTRKMKESEIPFVERIFVIKDTSQTTWQVPEGTRKIDIFIVGGGGSGGGGSNLATSERMSGGRGGEVLHVEDIPFVKNQVFNLKVAEGTNYGESYSGVDGNTTTFGEYTAAGGARGYKSKTSPSIPSGTKCPFGDMSDIDPDLTEDVLFAAAGGTAYYVNGNLGTYSGGETGGGSGTTSSTGGNASFYGSGGGGIGKLSTPLNYPGTGYQGIIIIKCYF